VARDGGAGPGEWVPVYDEMYRIYLDSYQQLKKQFKALAAL
jgi:hypothetical protein